MVMDIRDRINIMLADFGLPNGENDIDDIERHAWDGISDDELETLVLG